MPTKRLAEYSPVAENQSELMMVKGVVTPTEVTGSVSLKIHFAEHFQLLIDMADSHFLWFSPAACVAFASPVGGAR
jgi:hypothetical protein